MLYIFTYYFNFSAVEKVVYSKFKKFVNHTFEIRFIRCKANENDWKRKEYSNNFGETFIS